MKSKDLESRIARLKVGEHFFVDTERERQQVCRAAKTLRRVGMLYGDIITKRDGQRFKVAAI